MFTLLLAKTTGWKPPYLIIFSQIADLRLMYFAIFIVKRNYVHFSGNLKGDT